VTCLYADVLAFAVAQGRAVLTFNRRHFIRLHALGSPHRGIIVCTRDDDSAALAARIHQAIPSVPSLDNHLLRVARPPPHPTRKCSTNQQRQRRPDQAPRPSPPGAPGLPGGTGTIYRRCRWRTMTDNEGQAESSCHAWQLGRETQHRRRKRPARRILGRRGVPATPRRRGRETPDHAAAAPSRADAVKHGQSVAQWEARFQGCQRVWRRSWRP
jgi:hypothetical protein